MLGATQRYPMNLHLSPGWAFSALWFRRTMLIDLGIQPGGIEFGSCWTRIICISANYEFYKSNYHHFESQFIFKHFFGYVYLNCCSMGGLSRLQLKHLKTPTISSGHTWNDRVIVPITVYNLPSLLLLSSLIPQASWSLFMFGYFGGS